LINENTLFILIGIAIVVFLSIFLSFKLYEKTKPSAEETVLIAFITAIVAIGKFSEAALPGIEFGTFILIIAAFIFGRKVAIISGLIAPFIVGTFQGLGLQTPFQMAAMGFVGLMAAELPKILQKNMVSRVIFCFFTAIVFTLIRSVHVWLYTLLTNPDFTIGQIIGGYIPLMFWSYIHGVFIALLAIVIYKPFMTIFKRAKNRYYPKKEGEIS